MVFSCLRGYHTGEAPSSLDLKHTHTHRELKSTPAMLSLQKGKLDESGGTLPPRSVWGDVPYSLSGEHRNPGHIYAFKSQGLTMQSSALGT